MTAQKVALKKIIPSENELYFSLETFSKIIFPKKTRMSAKVTMTKNNQSRDSSIHALFERIIEKGTKSMRELLIPMSVSHKKKPIADQKSVTVTPIKKTNFIV